jgi:hypothetical protein
MSYKRVIPRDLFNEASLLKCLGHLALQINDDHTPEGLELLHRYPESGFPIEMDESDGSIFCSELTLKTPDGRTTALWRSLNSRLSWPLRLLDAEENDIYVFDEDGYFTAEFKNWVGPGWREFIDA